LAALLTVLASTAARQAEVGAVREDRGQRGDAAEDRPLRQW
jgi:hypothetical protein